MIPHYFAHVKLPLNNSHLRTRNIYNLPKNARKIHIRMQKSTTNEKFANNNATYREIANDDKQSSKQTVLAVAYIKNETQK